MAKKVIVKYFGSCRDYRGNEPMHFHTDTYTLEEWEKEDKELCDKESQEMALDYFEVSGWYEVEIVEED
ncbi:hypothetical protein M8850_03130 [Pasteurella multocida]|uniref:hypothetical protein n=1 Tax=Pasteurella multocida TaxID=747 RepID=UPI0020236B94|nr:hypothetical protein [Pasteurella multocida]URH94734.1 hypothetical protein M8850_03130 [Pasteurella multocida]URI01125.1 hypothetical protein M8851_03135 [Pasteurella multocida]HEA3249400.1 hypothetical protein [Pasteurella multocida]